MKESEGKIKKVVILGIDSLEYELVKKWKLKNLKQEEYGKVNLPLKRDDGFFYSEPITPIMWTSFITGYPPKKHHVDTIRKYAINSLYRTYLALKSFLPSKEQLTPIKEYKSPKRKFLDVISRALKKLGLAREFKRKDIKTSTIFDLPATIHLHVPVYDEDAFPNYKKRNIEAMENKVYRPIYELQCIQEFKQRSKEVFDWLEKNNWKLFMQYFYVLDGIQDVFYNQPKKIAKFYLMFDEFVRKVREKIDNETLLLIISDHGQKNGIHTNYGFYSLNKPLGLKNPKLIDFRWIIEDLLKN